MLKIFTKQRLQKGDTIVEVLLSIAIVSLAIAVSYAISGKNLNVGITARERTQALALVQKQIEDMKLARQISNPDLASPKGPHFCYTNGSGSPQLATGSIDATENGNLSVDSGNYNPNCVSDGKFYLDINYVPPKPNCEPVTNYPCGDSFAFTARWYRLGGGVDQLVTIYYRPW